MPDSDPEKRKAYAREHYARNKPKYLLTAKSHRQETREKIRGIIAETKAVPCMDCGGSFPVVCMDFDHRDPGTKNHNVSDLVKVGSVRILEEEIAKCDIVCANCHRIRTAARP